MDLLLSSSAFLLEIFFRYARQIAISTVILIGIFCWKYWKHRRTYDVFPTYSLDVDIISRIVLGGKENVPFTSILFQKLVGCCKRFESEGLCLLWGIRPLLFVYAAEYVKIFSNTEAAVDKMWFYEIVKDTLGTGMITSNGKVWRKSRKLSSPIFHSQMMKRSVAVFDENAEVLVKKLIGVANETPEDILDMLKKFTMDCFCESILGVKLRSSENDPKIENYIHSLSKTMRFTAYRFGKPWLYCTPLLPLFAVGREHRKYYKNIHQFSNLIVKEMSKSVSSFAKIAQIDDEMDPIDYRKSLSYLLFERHHKDPSFTSQDLQDEITNFIIAGHDTVAYAVLWAIFMLGHHQDVQDKVFDEVMSLPENDLTYEDVSNLTYLNCVIKETLRLYPSVPIYSRYLTKEVQCGKYVVPKGTNIVIFPYLLHRNPSDYPDPEKFDPERFSGRSEIRPWSYVPFSEGIRNCIGKRFAMLQMKVLLVHIIRNFKITSLVNQEDVDLCWDIVLTPAKPLLFHLKYRKIAED